MERQINPQSSQATFKVKLLSFITVNGSLSGMKGSVHFDPNQAENAKIQASVAVDTIDTKVEKRDAHLKRDDFFDAEKYPEITFTSSEVKKQANGYIVQGTLTMHGISKAIEIPFRPTGDGLIGTFQVNRKDFQVGKLPGFLLSNKIEVTVEANLQA